jgi:hypothetical protein
MLRDRRAHEIARTTSHSFFGAVDGECDAGFGPDADEALRRNTTKVRERVNGEVRPKTGESRR